MYQLKDSGERRECETGSVRDKADGKGRFDLMPFDIESIITNDNVIVWINTYCKCGDTDYLKQALLDFVNNDKEKLAELMLGIAIQYELGCQKYGERNWEKGQPLSWYINSMKRHYYKHVARHVDEPHNFAFGWNVMGAMWTHENKPEMIDLPFKDKEIKQ